VKEIYNETIEQYDILCYIWIKSNMFYDNRYKYILIYVMIESNFHKVNGVRSFTLQILCWRPSSRCIGRMEGNMNRLRKLLKDISLKSDIINVIVGVVLIVSLIIIFQNPYNRYAILIACISGGLMNILNGLKYRKDPKKKTMGMSFLMMGVIVMLLGIYIIGLI